MKIEEYLRGLLNLMLFDNYGIEMEEDEHYVTLIVSLPEAESGVLIGYHGDTLASIRRLLHTVFINEIGGRHVILHINDYRNRREEKIRQLVDRGIRHIRQTGRPFKLFRLDSAERFFTHNLIASDPRYADFVTYSRDTDEGRVLYIAPSTDEEDGQDDYDGDDDQV